MRTRLRIGGLKRQQEIIEELADHLEDAECDGSEGVQVTDWARFSEEIRGAEEDNVRSRLRTLWIPGLISGVLATMVLAIMQKAGLRPLVIQGSAQALVFYLPWLLTLPPIGAIAAYLSRRAGGNVKARLVVAVFPCLGMLAPMVIGGIVAMIGALFTGGKLVLLATLIAQFLAIWVALPAAALALGALPFLGVQKASEPQKAAAAHA